MSGITEHAMLAVLPILPAVPGLLVVLTLGASAVLAGIWSLRHPRPRRLLLQFLWSQRWSLLSMAAVGGASLAAYEWLKSERTTAVIPSAFREDVWQNRGGLTRSGALDGSPSPVSGELQWAAGTGYAFLASPAVAGGRIYAVGNRGNRARLFCWDRSGRQLWTASPREMRATFSSPVIAGHLLLIGEGLHHTEDAAVYCLDLRPGQEGDVVWTYRTRGHVECTPVIEGARVYVAAGDDGIYCLALDPVLPESQRLLWHAGGDRCPDVETALAVHEGRVYAGLGLGGEAVVVLDADDGSELARVPMPYPVYSPPAIAHGRLYVGAGTGDYLHLDNTRGLVAAVDLNTLDVVWTRELPGTVLGAIACIDRQVIFGCADGRVHVLDTEGNPVGEWNSDAPIAAAPAVTSDTIVLVNQAGMLYGLDRSSLQPVWETRLGSPGLFLSSPTVAGGHVFVGTQENNFLCVGESSAVAMTEIPPTGEVLWVYDCQRPILGPPDVSRDSVIVPAGGRDGGTIITLSNHGDERPRKRSESSTAAQSPRRIAALHHIGVIVTHRELLSVDMPTGAVLWKVGLPEIPDGDDVLQLQIQDNQIWLNIRGPAGTDGVWVCHSLSDGSSVPLSRRPPTVVESELVVRDDVILLRRPDGQETLWADCATLGSFTTDAISHGGRVYVGMGTRLVCLGQAGSP